MLLNLLAIEASLRRVQQEFEVINQRLNAQRDPLSDEVVENLLAGYQFVDALVESGIDVFSMGQHHHLLELNTLVLCGQNPARRAEFARISPLPSAGFMKNAKAASRILWSGAPVIGTNRSGNWLQAPTCAFSANRSFYRRQSPHRCADHELCVAAQG